MKNIHVLPTDKLSNLYTLGKELKLRYVKDLPIDSDITVNQHIYITSDEEIKEGDWYINTFVSEREQKPQTHTEKKQLINHQKDYRFKFCKKIILTTDQDLIKDGVQSIDDEFLEWFVKNPSCEFVKIEGYIYKGQYETEYKIIIPKEELYDRTTQSISLSEVDKQETLEEVATKEGLYRASQNNFNQASAGYNAKWFKRGTLFGAKWQQEQNKNKYSEEDMIEAIMFGANGMYGLQIGEEGYTDNQIKRFLDKFKNK